MGHYHKLHFYFHFWEYYNHVHVHVSTNWKSFLTTGGRYRPYYTRSTLLIFWCPYYWALHLYIHKSTNILNQGVFAFLSIAFYPIIQDLGLSIQGRWLKAVLQLGPQFILNLTLNHPILINFVMTQ